MKIPNCLKITPDWFWHKITKIIFKKILKIINV